MHIYIYTFIVIYSPSSFFIAITAIIPLLYFVIFLVYNSSISAIIVGIRVNIRVVIGLKKLGLKLKLKVIYIFLVAVRPIKYF